MNYYLLPALVCTVSVTRCLDQRRFATKLASIDALPGYGNSSDMGSLKKWLDQLEQVIETQSDAAYTCAHQLFKRIPYSDNSQRSRVYFKAQKYLIEKLQKSPEGRALLQNLKKSFPLIEILYHC